MLRQLMSASRGILTQGLPASSIPSLAADFSLSTATPLTSLLAFRSLSNSVGSQQQSESKLSEAHTEENVANRLPPWTATRLLQKRKTLPKRMGHLLHVLEQEKEVGAQSAQKHPDFGPGDFLELKLSVPENKRRATVFKGICIARRNRGYRTTFTVRNFIGSSGGIERSFPLYSPHLLEVKVLSIPGRKKYRRSKLYFLRDVQPRAPAQHAPRVCVYCNNGNRFSCSQYTSRVVNCAWDPESRVVKLPDCSADFLNANGMVDDSCGNDYDCPTQINPNGTRYTLRAVIRNMSAPCPNRSATSECSGGTGVKCIGSQNPNLPNTSSTSGQSGVSPSPPVAEAVAKVFSPDSPCTPYPKGPRYGLCDCSDDALDINCSGTGYSGVVECQEGVDRWSSDCVVCSEAYPCPTGYACNKLNANSPYTFCVKKSSSTTGVSPSPPVAAASPKLYSPGSPCEYPDGPTYGLCKIPSGVFPAGCVREGYYGITECSPVGEKPPYGQWTNSCNSCDNARADQCPPGYTCEVVPGCQLGYSFCLKK